MKTAILSLRHLPAIECKLSLRILQLLAKVVDFLGEVQDLLIEGIIVTFEFLHHVEESLSIHIQLILFNLLFFHDSWCSPSRVRAL